MEVSRVWGALVMGAVLALVTVPATAAPGRAGLLEPITVNGTVNGDVVSLGGDIHLGPRADVRGHVVALFGTVERDPAARVEGRVLAIRSLAGATLSEEGAAIPLRVRLGLDALLASVWLVVATVLAALLPGRVVSGAWTMGRLGLRVLAVGVMAYITLIIALIAAVSLGPAAAVPLMAMLMLVAVAGKAFGLTLLGAVVGSWAVSAVAGVRFPVTVNTFIGVAVLVCLRFVPVVGGLTWALVSVWAVGAGVLGVALGRSVFPLHASERPVE